MPTNTIWRLFSKGYKMVKAIVDAMKKSWDPMKALDWLVKVGIASGLGVLVVWKMCELLSLLVNSTITQSKEQTTAIQGIAVQSQRMADIVDQQTGVVQAALSSMKDRGNEHDRQFQCIEAFNKRIDQQDRNIEILSKGVENNGKALEKSIAIQERLLERMEAKCGTTPIPASAELLPKPHGGGP